jgi:hypothetical protein
MVPVCAVVFTLQHSGSVRFYAHRATLRWDLLEPDQLDRAIGLLAGKGYETVLLLDDIEHGEFQKRFGSASHLARLDWPPIAEYTPQEGLSARIYRPSDRSRFLAGAHVSTARIESGVR